MEHRSLRGSNSLAGVLGCNGSSLIGIAPAFNNRSFRLSTQLSFHEGRSNDVKLIPRFVHGRRGLSRCGKRGFDTRSGEGLHRANGVKEIISLISGRAKRVVPSVIDVSHGAGRLASLTTGGVHIRDGVKRARVARRRRAVLHTKLPIGSGRVIFDSNHRFVAALRTGIRGHKPRFIPKAAHSIGGRRTRRGGRRRGATRKRGRRSNGAHHGA